MKPTQVFKQDHSQPNPKRHVPSLVLSITSKSLRTHDDVCRHTITVFTEQAPMWLPRKFLS